MHPPTLKSEYSLWPYQQDAIDWMTRREEAPAFKNHGITGGIMSMQMGLGKTLTALEHTFSKQRTKNEQYPTLIVASKTVFLEWKDNGIEKFYDGCKALFFHKDFTNTKKVTAKQIRNCNLVVTTYDQCVKICKENECLDTICEYNDKGKVIAVNLREKPNYDSECVGGLNIYTFPWKRVIYDESQRFSNRQTYSFKAMMAIYADHKWCLTGSPVRNNDGDMWAQLRICGYSTIDARRWRRIYYRQQSLDRFVYEGNYEDLKIEMPPKNEHLIFVEMNPPQKQLYEKILDKTRNKFESMVQFNYSCVLEMFTRLRQTCIAPNLIRLDEDLPSSQDPIQKWLEDPDGSAGIDAPKIRKIIEIIVALPPEEKIIIFSMYTSCLKLVERAVNINIPKVKYALLVGGSTGPQRKTILNQFKEDPKVKILFCNYKVGGEGLNLIAANHVLCVDPWWSPVTHNQAIARCWRRGQTKTVHVYWIVTSNSIEEPVLKLCSGKELLAKHYLHGTAYTKLRAGLTKEEMRKLLYWTPLMRASNIGKDTWINELIRKGVDMNEIDECGMTALMQAASNGFVDCINALVSAGASVNMIDSGGMTALMLATSGGYINCMTALLKAGADPNLQRRSGNTALIDAVNLGCAKRVKLLLDAGADNMLEDKDGMTALSLAIKHGHKECIQILQEWNI